MKCNCERVWKFSDPAIDIALLEPEFEKHQVSTDTQQMLPPKPSAGSLIPILQKAQDLYGYLPMELLAYIAYRTGIKPSKVLGVVTFYTQFRTKPVGKHLILLCQGTACHVNGSSAVEQAIREYLNVDEGEITENGLFTYNNVACLGCCSLSPVMMINGKTYGALTGKKAVQILKEIQSKEAAQ